MSANIFISYASPDLKVATTLCKALEGRGFKCWISSRDVLPGENFQVAIVRAIRAARMMLLVFTGASNNSEEMTKELVLASQHRLIVVPLRIEDVAPNEAFSYEFATRQWIDFFADWEAAMDQLSQRIGTALASEPASAEGHHPHNIETHPEVRAPAPPPEVSAAAMAAAAAAAVTAAVASAEVKAPEPKAEAKPVETKAPEAKPAPAAAKAAAPAAAAAGAASAAGSAAKAPPAGAPPSTATSAAGAAAPDAKKGPPVGLFIGIGVVVALIVAGVLVLPGLLAKKPAPPVPPPVANTAVVAAPANAAAAPVAPLVAPVAPPSAPVAAPAASNEAAAETNSASNAVEAPTHHAAKPRAAHVASHTETDVPF
ncbi:MAG TPA: toll/interleukin-1 receptor domain-containing protein [Caulobacteraceae bacterium]|jgi:hypothetical protein